jgi:glyoxylase-like metal-dependent hydrolase (beta-lactamase superfamily II)
MLRQITEQTYYFPGANNIGIVTTADGGAIAIDTGLDKNIARKLRKALDEAGLTLRAIVNTHHHADHIGGNDYFVRNVPGVQVYAPVIEAVVIESPELEPAFLNYGATPYSALRTRWLMAQGVPVDHVFGDRESIQQGRSMALEVEGISFEVIPLPGHTMAQVGLVYDGVCFAADGFFGPAVVAKHGVLYAHNVAAQQTTFDWLAAREEHWFLPGHGDLVARAEIGTVLDVNRTATTRASELVLQALDDPGDIASVTARVFRMLRHPEDAAHNGEPVALAAALNIPQYVVFAGAISAHLSYLEQQERVRAVLGERGVIWQRL